MNEYDRKTLKSRQNRLSLPRENQNQTTKSNKYRTKANKTVLIIFCPCVYTHRPEPSPSLSQSVTQNGRLKRDVINERPLTEFVCGGGVSQLRQFSEGVVRHMTKCDRGRGGKNTPKCDVIIERPITNLLHSGVCFDV